MKTHNTIKAIRISLEHCVNTLKITAENVPSEWQVVTSSKSMELPGHSCAIFQLKPFQYQGIGATLKSLIAGMVPTQLFIPRSLETVNTYLNRKTL